MDLKSNTERIIGCAIEVHRELGAGLLETIYENALCAEFKTSGLCYERQKKIPVLYKGQSIGEQRVDLVVENTVVVELKSVERLDAVFAAQTLSYMKLGGYRLGLLINFNTELLKNGIRRFIL
jgi:GxxExxY protein